MTVRKDWRNSTLEERMKFVLARVAPQKTLDRTPLDTRLRGVKELAEKSGLPLGQITKLADGTTIAGQPPTLVKIARGGVVSFAWLCVGEGDPDDPNMWTETRALEIAVAFLGGWDAVGRDRRDAAVEEAKRHPERTTLEWADHLQAPRYAVPRGEEATKRRARR